MFCRSNSATTSPFLTRPPAFGSSSSTIMKSPSLPIEPPPPGPPPPLPVEPPTKPLAVDPRPLVPDELESDAFLLELLDAELEAAVRSEKRLVEPLLAPKLEAVWVGAPEAELSDADEVFALFEELTVIVEALWELESDRSEERRVGKE